MKDICHTCKFLTLFPPYFIISNVHKQTNWRIFHALRSQIFFILPINVFLPTKWTNLKFKTHLSNNFPFMAIFLRGVGTPKWWPWNLPACLILNWLFATEWPMDQTWNMHIISKDLVLFPDYSVAAICHEPKLLQARLSESLWEVPQPHHNQLFQLAMRVSEVSRTVGRTGLLLVGFIFGLVVSLVRAESSTQLLQHPHVAQWAPLPIWHVLLHVASHLRLHLASIPCCPAEACPCTLHVVTWITFCSGF